MEERGKDIMPTEKRRFSHEETRRAILNTARSLFARQGAPKTTLEDISRELHRTKSFVYHYFPNKDEILRALIESEGDEYMEELKSAVSKETGAARRLRAYLVARFRIFNRLGTFYSALREHYFEQYAFIEQAREKYDRFEAETVEEILLRGNESGELCVRDPGMAAHAILIALKGFEIEWATEKDKRFEETLDFLLSILFRGISRREGEVI